MRLLLVTPPAVEPVTLAEAKAHLRIEIDADDALVTSLIAAARQAAEAFTGRALIHQTWRLTLDGWPCAPLPWWDGVRQGADLGGAARALVLPRPPLASVVSVKTYAADGTPATVSSAVYQADAGGVPGRLILREGQSWPQPGRTAVGIEIEFVAGYGAGASAVPQAIRTGILAETARLYEHRGDEPAPQAAPLAQSLWEPYRLMVIA